MKNEFEYAGIFPRLKAYIADCLFLFIGLIISQVALYFVNPVAGIQQSGQTPGAWELQFWVFLTVTVPVLFYFALTQSSKKKATLGMRIFNLEVSGLEGEKISFPRAFLRCAVLLVPFEFNHTVIFHLMPRNAPPSPMFFVGIAGLWLLIALYLISIKLTRKKQSIHFIAAGTIVTNKER